MAELDTELRHRKNEGDDVPATDSPDDVEGLDRSTSLSEEFVCGCCYELMVQPTTLTCGHSFCRLCIANWYLASKKTECPQCRSTWQGNPQINITLRKLTEKMYSGILAERSAAVMTPEAKTKIENFDKEMSSSRNKLSSIAQGQGFCSGMCFALAILVVIYLSWFWRSSDKDLLVHKTLSHWTVGDVEQWLTDMGVWTENYVLIAKEKQIGGNLLTAIDEFNIEETLNVTEPLHKKALLNSLNIIKDKGVKPPSNMWEFKALYPGWTMFLMYGLKDNPRTLLFYLYLFEYQTMFLPFIHVVSPLAEGQPRYDFTSPLPEPTSHQWVEFVPKYLFLPYWMIAEFTWDWLDIHYWTSRFVLANCLALTLLEANSVVLFLRGHKQVFAEVKRVWKYFFSMALFMIVWPFVPSIICDIFFYVALYFSPYQVLEELYGQIRR